MTQQEALSILKTGASVFLTGEPGAGKTHTINAYVNYLRKREIEPAITASTGIAATHIGGMTIHSWSGIGIAKFLDKYALDRISSNERVVKRVHQAKVLIIDEVSMLGPETLLMVDAVCREIRQSGDPFGGIQVVLVGDFFQLPPIQNSFGNTQPKQSSFIAGETGRFAYESSAWKRLNPVVCYLSEQHRQSDATFLSILSAIRTNSFNETHQEIIAGREVGLENTTAGAPKLYTHNVDVDRMNELELGKIFDEPRTFSMSTRGPKPLVETLQKGCLSPETLTLKVGAAVMFTKNNQQSGFVNGTLGTVEEFAVSGYPIVRLKDGKTVAVEPVDWNLTDRGTVLAQITQLPLRLAWAITVHKSQGMSLDEAVMDLSQVFEFGQGYVAISRVRTLAGVHLLGYNDRAFKVHPDVLEEDHLFHEASDVAVDAFKKLPPEELLKMQDGFIKHCGGVFISEQENNKETVPEKPKVKTSERLEKVRERHPNAYRPWTDAQDKRLTELFALGTADEELAKIFGRKEGAVRMRLAKLGLIEALNF